jgi:uncharacterized protein
MSFAEILFATGSAALVPPRLSVAELQTSSAAATIQDFSYFTGELDLAWQKFLETGGFPRAVGSNHLRGEVDRVFARDLLAWLSSDVVPGEPAESVTELISVLHRRSGSPLDVKSTADVLHTSRDRLRTRLERLVGTFGAIWCHQADGDGNRRQGSQSKLYFSDPLIARLPSLTDSSAAPPDLTRSTEAALGVGLARAVDALHPMRYVEQRAVAYLRTGSGSEIDFAALPVAVGAQRTTSCPVESKWVSDGWRAEARTIAGKYGRGIVATKDITDLTGAVWAVPAPILALLLQQ